MQLGQRASSPFLLIALIVACFAVTVACQFPSLDVFFSDDALLMPHTASLIEAGYGSWSGELFNNWAGNYHPLWQLQFAAQLTVLPFDPVAWHLVNAAFHAGSACLLFFWMRSILGTWIGPLFSAILWAGAVVGGRDDPTMMIFEGHYPVTLFWMLAALLSSLQIRSERSLRWTLLTCLFASLAVLTWEIGILVLPMIVVQDRLVTGTRGAQRLPIHCIALLLLTSALLVGLIGYMKVTGGSSVAQSSGGNLLDKPVLFFMHFVESLTRLVMDDPVNGIGVLTKALIVFAVLTLAFALRRAHWNAIAISGILPLAVIAAVALFRVGELQLSADYLYYPTFWWCIVLGSIADAVLTYLPRFRFLLIPTFAVLVVSLLVHQNRKSESNNVAFGEKMQLVEARFREHQRLIEALLQSLSTKDATLRLPNVPVILQPELPLSFPLRSFVYLLPKETAERIEVISPDKFTDAEIEHLVSRLRGINTGASQQLAEVIATLIPELRALATVSKNLTGARRRLAVSENLLAFYPEFGFVTLFHSLSWLFAPPLDGFDFQQGSFDVSQSDLKWLNENEETPGWKLLYGRVFDRNWLLDRDYLECGAALGEWQRRYLLATNEGSVAEMVRYSGSLEWFHIDSIAIGKPEAWTVQLMHQSFEVRAGERYTIRFVASALQPREIQVSFSRFEPPWTLGAVTDLEISQCPTSYTVEVTPDENAWVSVNFNLGQCAVPVDIRQIEVQHEGERVDPRERPQSTNDP